MMKKYTEVFLLNSVPTLIQTGHDKCVVFSHCKASDQGPALYFYDVNRGCEVKRVKGGEAIIDFKDNSNCEAGHKGLLTMLGNKEIMSDNIWGKDMTIKEEHAEKYDTCSVSERKCAIVISIKVDLSNESEFDVLSSLPNDALIQRPSELQFKEENKV